MRLLRRFALFAALSGCSGHAFVTQEAAQPVLFRRATVFDARAGKAFDGPLDVLVRDGKIARVGPALPPDDVKDARVVEGGFLMPGLIDLHVHVGSGSAPPWHKELPDEKETLGALLYAGVTSVLDLASLTPNIFELREKIRRGDVLGPHLYAAGPAFTAPGGHPAAMMHVVLPWPLDGFIASRLTREVATPEAARAAVDALVPYQPDVIKLAIDAIPTDVPSLEESIARAVVEEAHAKGLRAVAHIGSSANAVTAVHAGVDALVHGVYLEPISDEAITALQQAKIPVVFTCSVFDSLERLALDHPVQFNALETQIAKKEVREAMAPRPADFDGKRFEPWIRKVLEAHQARRDNIRKLRAAGVPVLVGSDSANVDHIAGAGLHQELDALMESGMTPGEALSAATFGNARFLLGENAEAGEVAAGKRADLLWLKGNPLEEPARVHEPGLVVLDGRVLNRVARP